jgi:choline kinase
MKAIICAAGMGTRLGLNLPKSLIKIKEKYLIEYQFEALADFDITVILGYKHNLLLDIISNYNCNFIVNNNYMHTNTSHSISLSNIDENCLILDGDLLFSKKEIDRLHFNEPWVGTSDVKSFNPVFAKLNNNKVINISHNKSNYEWSCICYMNPKLFENCTNEFVFEVLNKHMPITSQKVNVYEIDTVNDLNGVNIWLSSMMK